MTEDEIRTLVAQGSGRIPCSRYAREDGSDLADWVIRLEAAMVEATGEESDEEGIEYLTGLIVNSHDDVAYVLELDV